MNSAISLLKASGLYFLLVFGAGFLIGPIRIWWLELRLGVRTAELLEMPVMIAVTIAAAWRVVRGHHPPFSKIRCTGIGAIALLLMFGAEFMLVWMRGLSPREYLATRDPVSGTAYLAALALFAAMPLLVGRINARVNAGSQIRAIDASQIGARDQRAETPADHLEKR